MKRIIFVTLMVLLAAFCFANGNQEGESSAGENLGLTSPGTFPIVEETAELSYMIPQNQSVGDYEDNVLTRFLEERTNVKINLRLTSSQDYKNKMNLMFASQADLPDMINLQNTDVNGQLMWGLQGVLMPLNDLIDEQAVLFQGVLNERPDVKNLIAAADGNIYSFPSISSCPHCDPSNRFWINKVWLDNLGLDMPETTEELYAVLKAFRDDDPNGNGLQDEIPLIGARNGWQMDPTVFLLNSFVDWDNIEKMYVKDGTIVPAFTQPAFRKGLEYINGLVEEGLLDPITYTQDQNQLRTLIKADPNIIGIFPAGGAFFHADGSTKDVYVHLDPVQGPEGVRLAPYNPWSGIGNGAGSVTTDAETPEIAVRWFDQFFDMEVTLKARFGREGTDWRWANEDDVALNSAKVKAPAIMLENVWSVTQPHNIHWYLMHPYYMPISIETADWDAFDAVAKMGDSSMKLLKYTPPMETQVPPLALMPEEIEEYQDLWSTLDTYVKESMVRFIVGDLDLQNDWDKYIGELKNAKLDRYLELKQQAYDRGWK